MLRPIYEIVVAEAVKVGDVIRAGGDGFWDFAVHDYRLKPGDGEVIVHSLSGTGKIETDDFAEGEEIFRRVLPESHPDVLRLALESACSLDQWLPKESRKQLADRFIAEAMIELEAKSAKGGE